MIPAQMKCLIAIFKKLPGIGPKSAERMVFYLIKQPKETVLEFAKSLVELQKNISYCKKCCHITSDLLCEFCQNSKRDHDQLCIVEESRDVYALEQAGIYKGLYHVLHGVISPLDRIGPEQLTIDRLIKRFSEENIKEVILATNPTVPGEATSSYLHRILKPRKIRITHLAQGIPLGGVLEFADPDTLKTALKNRREYE